jgi:hypothetical protein
MTRRIARCAVAPLLAALVLVAPAASAQVNVESLRRDMKDRHYLVAFDANVAGYLGNVNGVVAGGGLFGAAHWEPHLVFLRVQGDFAQFGGVPTVAKAFGHLRYNYQILPWLAGELFTQVQQDKFQRLALRQVNGIGPRFGVIRSDAVQLYLGTAYMTEYEKLSDTPGEFGAFRGAVITASRWSNYVSLIVPIGKTTVFTSVLYVQPRFDYPKDVRVLNETILTVKIVDHLMTKLDVLVRHDSLPPSGVRTTDVTFTNGLSLSF